jgi:hypothetical protein
MTSFVLQSALLSPLLLLHAVHAATPDPAMQQVLDALDSLDRRALDYTHISGCWPTPPNSMATPGARRWAAPCPPPGKRRSWLLTA